MPGYKASLYQERASFENVLENGHWEETIIGKNLGGVDQRVVGRPIKIIPCNFPIVVHS